MCTWIVVSVWQHHGGVRPESELIVLCGDDNRLRVLRIKVIHVGLWGDRPRGRVIQMVLNKITHQVSSGGFQLHEAGKQKKKIRVLSMQH